MTSFHVMIWSFDPLFLIIDSHIEIRHHPPTGDTCFPDFSFFWDPPKLWSPWDPQGWFKILDSKQDNYHGLSLGLPPSLFLWALCDLGGSVLFTKFDTISENTFSRIILLVWEVRGDSLSVSWQSSDSHGTVSLHFGFSYFTSFYAETINLLTPSIPEGK